VPILPFLTISTNSMDSFVIMASAMLVAIRLVYLALTLAETPIRALWGHALARIF
jgi:hypothetical protein